MLFNSPGVCFYGTLSVRINPKPFSHVRRRVDPMVRPYFYCSILAFVVALSAESPPDVQGQSLALDAARASRAARNAPRIPLVADGYCVVTLRDARKWRPGDSRAATLFDGREYRFAGPREQAIFLAAPESYAPVLGGDCPVTYAESNERRAGQLRFAALHRGRIYFFADETCLHRFTQQPQLFENVDLAYGGRCPVTRRTENLEVAGIPATVATYGGIRYFFASMHQREVFLLDPESFGARVKPQASSSSNDQAAASALPQLDKSEFHPTAGPDQSTDNGPGDRHSNEDILLDSQPAMGGYCPVSIRESGVWVRGRYDYRVELGDLVLLTAGPAEHDSLLHDPVKYIPALGGDCVATWVDDGQRVRGSIFHAAEYHGRLFLFADAPKKATFKADPERYASADLAAGGACRVTQVDESRTAAGLAEFSAWHGGLVYHFSGAEQKKQFLAAPERYIVAPPAETDGPATVPE